MQQGVGIVSGFYTRSLTAITYPVEKRRSCLCTVGLEGGGSLHREAIRGKNSGRLVALVVGRDIEDVCEGNGEKEAQAFRSRVSKHRHIVGRQIQRCVR